ncbi:MAG: electron transport complex subunit E [Oscillospiraceae bacterium]|nr:electron transport complex subunit E [Oscillospiraceae bacterium]
MAEKKSLGKTFTKGILIENPVFRLVLGTCPTLAVSTSVVNALGMGIATMMVLICSNVAISALRKVIPDKVRIPAFVVIIASFVSVVQMLMKAFVPAINDALGVFLPLIVVNCVIFGRAESFANKNPVLASAVDGFGMGTGFTAALLSMALVREILGAGTVGAGTGSLMRLFGDNVLNGWDGIDLMGKIPAGLQLAPIAIFILPAGGFFVFGLLIALTNKITAEKRLPEYELHDCAHCPMSAMCRHKEDLGVRD